MSQLQSDPGKTPARKRRGRRAVGGLWLAISLSFTALAPAQVIVTWQGGTGNINDAKWVRSDSTVGSLNEEENVTLVIDGGKKIDGVDVNSVVNVNNNGNHRDITITTGDTLNVLSGRTLKVSSTDGIGHIINDGVLMLSASTDPEAGNPTTTLTIASGIFTLSGTGAITLSDSASNKILGDNSENGLINAAGHTIQGAGQVGDNSLTLTNDGLIRATGTKPLVIDVTGTSFTNNRTGVLHAQGSGGLQLNDTTFTNSGLVVVSSGSRLTAAGTFTQTAGSVFLLEAGGTASSTSFTIGNGAFLGGGGTLAGAVTNSGGISPGGSFAAPGPGTGTLTFNNALTLTNTSVLFFEIGGISSYDKLIAPTVTLDGLLVLTFTNNFQNTVAAGDTFTLISTTNASGLSGLFTSLPNGSLLATADGFGSFKVNYTGNSLTISNFSPVPEPSIYALFGTGLLALVAIRRRRR